jgi:hypothetical protein
MPWWAVRVFYAAAAIGEWRFLHTTSSRGGRPAFKVRVLENFFSLLSG